MKDVKTNQQDFESYLYIITHDLKTYSRAMRMIPEWIEEDLLDAEQTLPKAVKEHMQMLQSYAAGMDRMLDGLTELSRVGRLSDGPAPLVLSDAVKAVWQRFPENDFSLDISGVEGTVVAPANDLNRLLRALLSNAIQHHTESSGSVRVTSRIQDDRAILRVQDDGPGIPFEEREKVFDPLYTMQPKDESGTAGIGLAVARKVVHLMGGQIAAIDPPGGKGTCIECDLPLAR